MADFPKALCRTTQCSPALQPHRGSQPDHHGATDGGCVQGRGPRNQRQRANQCHEHNGQAASPGVPAGQQHNTARQSTAQHIRGCSAATARDAECWTPIDCRLECATGLAPMS